MIYLLTNYFVKTIFIVISWFIVGNFGIWNPSYYPFRKNIYFPTFYFIVLILFNPIFNNWLSNFIWRFKIYWKQPIKTVKFFKIIIFLGFKFQKSKLKLMFDSTFLFLFRRSQRIMYLKIENNKSKPPKASMLKFSSQKNTW